MAFSAILQLSFKVASGQSASLALQSSCDRRPPGGDARDLGSVAILDQRNMAGNIRGGSMRPLSLIAVKRERSWTRSGLALLAAFMLLAFLLPSPSRAQEAEKDRQKADRAAPPDWDAGLVDLLLPARRAKPSAALMNQGFIAPGSAFVNPSGAGTINNRAAGLRFRAGSPSAPAQFSGTSNPPSTPDNWLRGPADWANS